LKTEADRKSLSEEIVDRYGNIPEPVEMLLEIAELKQLCQALGVGGVISGGDNVKITLDETKSRIDPSKLVKVIQGDRRLSLSPPGRLMVNTKGLIGKPLLLALRRILVRAFK
jgi:transcription-repair coupling factor (superfamily II helicase)